MDKRRKRHGDCKSRFSIVYITAPNNYVLSIKHLAKD
jgi:hypothetical protein